MRAQVGVIRVAEVNISNAIKDQSDGAATERALQKQWARKLADARKQLSKDGGALRAATLFCMPLRRALGCLTTHTHLVGVR